LIVAAGLAAAALCLKAGHRGRVRASAPPAGLPAPPREIRVGQMLPRLVLADDRGRATTLAEAGAGAPTLFLFFRAASCPICRAQLRALRDAEARFRSAGVSVVACSPDTPETLAALRSELGVPMRLLSDTGERAVNELCGGVAHCQIFADAAGVIRWGAFAESWSHPPAPEAVLAALGGS
jgi:peroxiredoxin